MIHGAARRDVKVRTGKAGFDSPAAPTPFRRMILDWDLWPYRVAAGAGDVMLRSYVVARNIDAAFAEIGRALYSVLRSMTTSTSTYPETKP